MKDFTERLLFKEGDVVRVKSNPPNIHQDSAYCDEMDELFGKEFKISHIDKYDPRLPYYLECGYWWKQEWLEPVRDANIEVSANDLMELLG